MATGQTKESLKNQRSTKQKWSSRNVRPQHIKLHVKEN